MSSKAKSREEEDSDHEEAFEDALDSVPVQSEMDLDTAMTEANLAINLFFNNRFSEAREIMKPWAHCSMYHALGYGTFMYLQAVMTFNHKDIEEALEVLKQAVEVCNRYRRKATMKDTISSVVKRQSYDNYTEEEAHAELCYAESLLQRAMLTFMEDETLVSFVKAGLKIRSCYNSYKECWHMLQDKNWKDSKNRIHFDSGVRMGVGTFNLMISQLPQRILKLLEFIGFGGSKEMGLKQLKVGYEHEGSIRRVLCAMVLLGYHTMVTFVLGVGEGDMDLADSIVQEMLRKYPEGAWFLFFAGRVEFVKANLDQAVHYYKASWHSQKEWVQFHHLCFWELMWCHCFRQEWRAALEYSDWLLRDSRWSKCTYAYQKAIFLCMMNDELTEEEKAELEELMTHIPLWKQRIAGKSLPMEKFAVKKAARFFAQGNQLVLPAIEMVYTWNGFMIVGKRRDLVEDIYVMVERELKDLENTKVQGQYHWDNVCLCLLLKGVCLRFLESPLQAEECFRQVVGHEKQLVDDHYLVPYAVAEIGFLLYSLGSEDDAKLYLESAKNNYKGYSLESRLHFRIHAVLRLLKNSDKSSQGSMSSLGSLKSFSSVGNSALDPHTSAELAALEQTLMNGRDHS